MSYGIPYKGSKNIYAAKILEALPPGKRLVDLFAGGCAITDCAIRKFPDKWETVLVNDIDERPLNLYKSCLMGVVPVSDKYVSREEFENADWATRLVWSFGYNCRSYLYGRNIEERKRKLHEWVLTCECEDGEFPGIGERKNRRLFCVQKNNVQSERLEHIERLERLESLHNPFALACIEFSYMPYWRYEHKEGDVVYCDIPYQNTACDQYIKPFNHDKFWKWAIKQPYDVYVSERRIPDLRYFVGVWMIPNRAAVKGTYGYKREYLLKV